jgi:hypothetical protein
MGKPSAMPPPAAAEIFRKSRRVVIARLYAFFFATAWMAARMRA